MEFEENNEEFKGKRKRNLKEKHRKLKKFFFFRKFFLLITGTIGDKISSFRV
jgi:hypothetical protein